MVACAGIATGIYAGLSRRDEVTRVAERAVYITAFMTLAMLCLFWALATNDFSLAYVAKHSARSMPLHYRLGALWGGQAGSLLLWGWMVAVYGSAALWANRNWNRTLAPWVAAILLGNAAFFLVLTNFVTIPFERLPHNQVLSDGTGLNPLLQHPVMMIHPVMLYTGFTGFAVPFAYALAALITGELDTTWFRTTRRWTLIAWTALSAGIILGGRWAYEVLGWGGYWAWDPVENASLMPWIAGTAYLHSVIIQEKRDMLRMWNVVLIGLTYGLCLFGTFLTRSGIVQSVHAFTDASGSAQLFLGYVAAIFFGFAIYRSATPQPRSSRLETMVSREASFVLNNWASWSCWWWSWGTLLPVFSESLGDGRVHLGPPYFHSWAGPPALLLLFLMGAVPVAAVAPDPRHQPAPPARLAHRRGPGHGPGSRDRAPGRRRLLAPRLLGALDLRAVGHGPGVLADPRRARLASEGRRGSGLRPVCCARTDGAAGGPSYTWVWCARCSDSRVRASMRETRVTLSPDQSAQIGRYPARVPDVDGGSDSSTTRAPGCA